MRSHPPGTNDRVVNSTNVSSGTRKTHRDRSECKGTFHNAEFDQNTPVAQHSRQFEPMERNDLRWAPLVPDNYMNRTQGWLGFILAASLIASLLMHQIYAGAYMRSTPAGNYTYFIGVVSTSIPFVFWALITFSVSLIGRARANH